MYATYYDRTFPDGHDMNLIRQRVVEVGASMDQHQGLGFTQNHRAAARPRTWRLLRFVLWANEVPADEHGERFEVMQLSAPGVTNLMEITDVRDAV